MPKQALFVRTLVELADTLVADFDVVELLTRLADRCVDVLDVGAAGLMLAGPDGNLRVVASSSEAMRVLELFELQAEEGPCLDCYRSGKPVVDQDLVMVNSRWPRFAAEALAGGFRSVHALPMRLRGTVIGALNLFRLEPGEMQGADVEAAQALADVATIGILQHRATLQAQVVNQQLQHALNSRIVIEQAKGMVAEREHLNMEQAFSALRNHARNHNLRLVDVARAVIDGPLAVSALDRVPRPGLARDELGAKAPQGLTAARDQFLADLIMRDERSDELRERIAANYELGEEPVMWAPTGTATSGSIARLPDRNVPCVLCLTDRRLLWAWHGQDALLALRLTEVTGMAINNAGWLRVTYQPAEFPQGLGAVNQIGELHADFLLEQEMHELLISGLQALSPMYEEWRRKSGTHLEAVTDRPEPE